MTSDGPPAVPDGRGDFAGHPAFDTSVAHIARVYDYWLGGKDNYAADRRAGDAVIEVFPGIVAGVRANRAFLARAVRFLAGEAGIRQFLDIGTGIPSADNTHEVAQALAPESRVVYVDNDPVVLAHARALLTSEPGGVTAYIDADLRDTERILAEAAETLDFSRPVAVMLIMVMHLIGDEEDPAGIAARLMAAVPSGSYLALSHPASDIVPQQAASALERMNAFLFERVTFRDRPGIERFFHGLEMVEPGVAMLTEWRPEPDVAAKSRPRLPGWAGVGRKP